MQVAISEVEQHTPAYAALLVLGEQLNQATYLAAREPYIERSVLLGAFHQQQCLGLLRLVLQVIGSEHSRTPIVVAGRPLREGYVEAFGVAPAYRRQGIGQRLQQHAIALCRQEQCYQIRSRSPISSVENYALKLKLGYAIQPSHANDSYYFIKTLR